MVYALGPVKPHVKTAADSLGKAYGVTTIYGVASRSNASDHPAGLALDFMVYGDRAKGQAVADAAKANAAKFNISYVIWYQQIWSVARASEGWRDMDDRGTATANHMDHVHVSFNAVNSSGVTAQNVDFDPPGDWPNDLTPWDGVVPNPGIPDSVEAFFSWISNSHNWVRIAMIVGGVILILLTLVRLGAVSGGLIEKVKTR